MSTRSLVKLIQCTMISWYAHACSRALITLVTVTMHCTQYACVATVYSMHVLYMSALCCCISVHIVSYPVSRVTHEG